MRTLFSAGLVAALLLGCVGEIRAGFVSDTLGTAGPGNYAILTLTPTGGSDIALNGPGTTNGNVGISSPGNLQLNASNNAPVSNTAINGNLYLGNTATVNNTAQVSGTVFTNQNSLLSQANTDALNAATAFANLTPTQSVPGGKINGTTTINGGAGVNVVNVSGINLGNGQSLTLNGPAGSQFVVNVSGNLTLNSGTLALSGGLTPSDVVYNFTGNNPSLQSSGGLNNESVANGILLAPKGTVDFAPGLVNGELIANGQHVHLVSGASVNQTPPGNVVPVPPSVVLMGLGGLAFAATLIRGRRRATPAGQG